MEPDPPTIEPGGKGRLVYDKSTRTIRHVPTAPFDPAAAAREWLETMQGSGLTFAERHESLTALATRAYAAGVEAEAGAVRADC